MIMAYKRLFDLAHASRATGLTSLAVGAVLISTEFDSCIKIDDSNFESMYFFCGICVDLI